MTAADGAAPPDAEQRAETVGAAAKLAVERLDFDVSAMILFVRSADGWITESSVVPEEATDDDAAAAVRDAYRAMARSAARVIGAGAPPFDAPATHTDQIKLANACAADALCGGGVRGVLTYAVWDDDLLASAAVINAAAIPDPAGAQRALTESAFDYLAVTLYHGLADGRDERLQNVAGMACRALGRDANAVTLVVRWNDGRLTPVSYVNDGGLVDCHDMLRQSVAAAARAARDLRKAPPRPQGGPDVHGERRRAPRRRRRR